MIILKEETNYEKIVSMYPIHISEIQAKIKKGRSRRKNDPICTFGWFYIWETKVEKLYINTKNISIERLIKMSTKGITIYLGCSVNKGRNSWYSNTKVNIIPEEIKNFYRSIYTAFYEN